MSFWEVVPWFVPGLLVSIGISLNANRLVAAALAVSRTMAAAGLLILGIIVSATLTPLRQAIESGATGSGACDLSRVALVPLAELMAVSANDSLLNVVLFLPLGVVIGLAPRTTRKVALILAAGLLPFLIESTQLLVPTLARACESADVFDNLTGLAVGLVTGSSLRRFRS
ncbi:MAG: VanZ family protein [Thermoleophilaceae bacterium]|nr:VanZ family protein [Thermoleophilaceae bacterium]